MLIVLLSCFAPVAFSQTAEDAVQLIQEVADSAKNTVNWRIEGSIDYLGSSAKPTERFSLLMRAPNEARFEQEGPSTPAIIVCDGVTTWLYSPPLRRYRKESVADNKLCSPIVEDWKSLASKLGSPALAGPCGPTPSTQSSGYTLVRGISEPDLASSGRINRSLCIDTDRKQVVWEQWKNKYGTRVYRYPRLDRSAEFAGDAFVFRPPAESTLTEFEMPTPRSMGSRGMSSGLGVVGPRLVTKKEPKYPAASRNAGIEGTVILYVVIGTDGVPFDIEVFHPLSPELDKEAVKAVRQWRFTSGERDGHAVALPVSIEVNFRLRR